MAEQNVATYRGNCHCGAFRFSLRYPSLSSNAVTSCTCSLCAKQGYLWVVPAAEDDLRVTRGSIEHLTTYESAALTHKFCPVCGTGALGWHQSGPLKGKQAVNVRCLMDVNPFALAIEQSDGRSDEIPPHTYRAIRGDDAEADTEGDYTKMYTASCHCGSVQAAVRSKPIADVEIKEDNCSICVRNAFIGIYPSKSAVTLHGVLNTIPYAFSRGFNGHPFCSTCGVHVFGVLYGPPAHVMERLPEAKKDFVLKTLQIQPVNVRALDLEKAEWHLIQEKIVRNDDGTEGYTPGD